MAVKNYKELTIYRPVQYLGSKVRSIPEIIDAVKDTIGNSGTCLDLFAGSSVVSQALRNSGWKVIANDALLFSYLTNSAFIDDHYSQGIDTLIYYTKNKDSICSSYLNKMDVEAQAIHDRDYETLVNQNLAVVNQWKSYRPGCHEKDKQSIAKLLYSGTYFGFTQAFEIDAIRNAINEALSQNKISAYERSLMMTALFSAMSKSVFSAGKHFAQPHLIKPEKNIRFISKRILQDRAVNIRKEFEAQLKNLIEIKLNGNSNGSFATNFTMEEIAINSDVVGDVDLIYADPPYTAQQYSRFYHIPEVLSGNSFPDLQLVKGKITKGIYPLGRFKSKFCSKTNAPNAFRELCLLAKEKQASLILSYSLSKKESTGNDRMIEFDALLRILREYFGTNINHYEFGHNYRQFNNSESVVKDKEDKEIQIVCGSC